VLFKKVKEFPHSLFANTKVFIRQWVMSTSLSNH
jgi:hypothetical protein